MKILHGLAVAGWLGAVGAFAADEAVVKASRVNVRGQPTTGSEVVTQFKQGEKLTVLEEITHEKPALGDSKSWLRIALPANTPVWTSAQFVSNGTVSAARLNVRTGPGENFSVIGRLLQGAAVKEIRRAGDWLEIEAPAGSYAFIAADLVTREFSGAQLAGTKPVAPKAAKGGAKVASKSAKTPIAAPPQPPPLDVVEVKPVAALPPALNPGQPPVAAALPAAAVFPIAPAIEPPPLTPPPAPAPAIVPPPAVLTENPPPVQVDPFERTGNFRTETEPKRGFGNWLKGLFSRNEKASGKAPAPPKPAPPAVADEGPAPVRIVTREGVVIRSYNIQSPSAYALQEPASGRIINYLWTSQTNIPWDALKGRMIIVTGEEALDARWPKTPVLRIETLKTADE